jgi:hypothetical protein
VVGALTTARPDNDRREVRLGSPGVSEFGHVADPQVGMADLGALAKRR